MVSHTHLLRASGKPSGLELDLRLVSGESADPDGGVPEGAVLRRFAEAVIRDRHEVRAAREACRRALGDSRTVQAATIIASFDGINRVADATGIRLDETTDSASGEMIDQLGFDRMAGSAERRAAQSS